MKIKFFFTAVFLLLTAASCRTLSQIESHSDSIYVYREKIDTVYQSTTKWDSIYVHDSVFVKTNDSVITTEIWRWRDRYSLVHDTVYISQSSRDTSSVKTADAEEKIKQPSLWERIKADSILILMVLVLLLCAARFIFRK